MAEETLTLPEGITPAFAAQAIRMAGEAWERGDLRVDCRSLASLDSAGMAFFAWLQNEAGKRGKRLQLRGLRTEFRGALGKMPASGPAPETAGQAGAAERAGEAVLSVGREIRDGALLFSESLFLTTLGLGRKKTLLPGSVALQMVRLGSSALFIVLLLSTLIGFTLALQSGLQLSKYGAAIFLADGIGIGMVTEIGPVMTAVILAGRSGSAITAEIATMVVQEEVAALRSMAINPIHFLALPRFWALSITQPLLTVASCLAGIGSGLLVGILFFGLSTAGFLGELKQAVHFTYIWQALVKSLTFSWLIVFIAIGKGLGVRGGADAVGRATTACVVNCIFAIILADAVFSFLFYV